MINLPSPRATLGGCMWLPRIIAKARLLESGALPAEYADRFCHPTGVDAQFLRFFELKQEDVKRASRGTDEQVASWFGKLPAAGPSLISQWNEVASNLGRPGFPMAERLPVALATTYKHLEPSKFSSVFEVIEADEAETAMPNEA
jgi:Domain of unknown function (DUF5069)